MPTYAMKDFGFGVLAQTLDEAKVNSNGSITYRSVYQIIPTAGFALRLAEGIVRIGYSIQYVNESDRHEHRPFQPEPARLQPVAQYGLGVFA